VREQMPHEDEFLVAPLELRHIAGDGIVQVEQAPLDQQHPAHVSNWLRDGSHQKHGILAKRRRIGLRSLLAKETWSDNFAIATDKNGPAGNCWILARGPLFEQIVCDFQLLGVEADFVGLGVREVGFHGWEFLCLC